MFYFDQIPPKQFAILPALLGVLLTEALDTNEQNSFGNFLVSIGQALTTNAAQSQTQEAICEDKQKYDHLCREIAELNIQLAELKKQIK